MMMRTLILINSFVYRILMTSREKYNIYFLRDDGVTVIVASIVHESLKTLLGAFGINAYSLTGHTFSGPYV